MKRAMPVLIVLVLSWSATMSYADSPAMADVVRSPQDYAGQKIEFADVGLSGKITTYDLAGVRKYYLTLASRDRTFEVGFFLAPPALADKLAARMNAETRYRVSIVCRVEKIVINRVPQWHGIVTRVDFLNEDGRVTDSVREGRK